MRAIAILISIIAIAASDGAQAQTGFYLPTSTPSSGQDEFRAADGTSCRSTMDGTKRVEVGTFSYNTPNQNSGYNYVYSSSGNSHAYQGNIGAYGRLSISLDARPERMDCNKLFELELERRRLEVEIMKRSLLSADRELDQQKRNLAPAGNNISEQNSEPQRTKRRSAKSSSGLRSAPL